MAFVTSHTRMFVPIPDNPLHLASSSTKPLFEISPSPSHSPPLASTSLQKRSSLKEDDIPNSNDTRHTVRWSSPISISRMIPSRESDTINLNSTPAVPAQTTSIPWSLSQSLTLNEHTQCETPTLFELDPYSPDQRKRKGSSSVLSFSRPRALLTRSEELQARMNLMHLQKVIQPKIFSLSMHPSYVTTKSHPSKATNAKASRHGDPVFRPATSINIPKQNPRPRLKRRSTTPDHKRPRKVPKTDENTLAEFPSLKLDQLLDNSSAEPPSSEDDPCDDDESDAESLFGDHEFEGEVAVRNNVTKNSVSRSQGPRRPLNSIKVVNWTNGLQRFQYLLQKKKMDWRHDDELYEFLNGVDAEKDNITIELLKKTQVGRMIRDLSKCDNFEERSRVLAKRIYKSWRKMCRAVEQ